MYRILSIDGGGIRGIIPAMVLSKIEEITKKPICKMFDMIAGTSTGGIIALGLTMPNNKVNVPEYKATDLIKLFLKEGKRIFNNSLLHKIYSLNGVNDAKYKSNGIESVLNQYFGKTMLSKALTDVFITSYETELRTPFFFRSRLAKDPQNKGYDFEMWKAGRSTSASPTYFKPFKLEADTSKGYYSLIDGGIYANNPAMCAYAEAKSLYKSTTDIMVLSIGTGELTRSIDYKNSKNWGLLKWAKPIFDISMDGVNATVEYQLNQILPRNRHYRLQVNLAELGKDDMDNASDENIHELMLLGQRLIDKNMENGILYKICADLLLTI